MVQFTIKDLERISGIKAHTIRIWEQRYNIFNPQRTIINTRFYSNEDLKRIMNVSILNNNGFKISKIAELTPQQLNDEVKKIVDLDLDDDDKVNGLVMSMVELNEDLFNEIISYSFLQKGFIYTIENYIYPFFEKIGMLWQTGVISPAQEHFISNLIRQKIIAAIDSIQVKTDPKKDTFLLFLPDSEMHETGLLVYYYLLKSKGYKVIYLGQSVPYKDLKQVQKIIQSQKIISVFTNPFPEGELQVYIDRLANDFPTNTIYISGYQFSKQSILLPKNVILYKGLGEFKLIF